MRTLTFILLITLFYLTINAQDKDSFSTKPILRLETGMHTAPMRRIAIDSKERFLVTVSDDKTVRVWDVSGIKKESEFSLRLLRIIRPPIGEGSEGTLSAVAISPDGETIVTGGWNDPNGNNSIYFVDIQSGKIVQKLDGIEGDILGVVYSPDGNTLVASLGEGGIRVFQRKDKKWEFISKDIYNCRSFKNTFSPDGKYLITGCFDFKIRVYETKKFLENKEISADLTINTKEKKEPISIAFSPSGKEIAIGYNASTSLDIYKFINKNNKISLEYFYTPKIPSVEKEELSKVAFSGGFLYAGGTFKKDGVYLIRRWDKNGAGNFIDFPTSKNHIFDIIEFSKGIIFSSRDPILGAYDFVGKQIFYKESNIADFRGNLDGNKALKISNNGEVFSFPYEFYGKEKIAKTFATFDIKNRSLQMGESNQTIQAKIKSEKILITDWNEGYPSINGIKFPLSQFEQSRSISIHPKDSGFLLGTKWHLYYLDLVNNKHWAIKTNVENWAVNISGDGKFAIAAFEDGIIRWYRIEDGKEILAFFPHADKKRWVLWTPEGYYDASIGGEELIGWHVNRAKDKESDFFPVSKVRKIRCRPDVISKVLEYGDTAKAIAKANEELKTKEESDKLEDYFPPVVTILTPLSGMENKSNEVEIEYELRSISSQTVDSLYITVNGALLKEEKLEEKLQKEETVKKKIRVSLKDEISEISIVASNRYAPSEPAKVKVVFKNATKTALTGNLLLFAVGIGKYQFLKGDKHLKFPAKDATDFMNAFQKQKGISFQDVLVPTPALLDDKATRGGIINGLKKLTATATEEDTTLILLSGHGFTDPIGNYSFLPSDFKEDDDSSVVSSDDILKYVASIKGKKVLFMDACYSSNLSKQGFNLTKFINTASEQGTVIMTSSLETQESLESKRFENGAFTFSLVEGILKGAAVSGKKNIITVLSLADYVTQRVEEITEEKLKRKQSPTLTMPSSTKNFKLGEYKKE